MPCVGLVVLAGCLTFIVAPDEPLSLERRVATAVNALPRIVLDPGHGGKDDGARAHGLVEKEMTLDVALRTEKLLQSFGFETVLTRRDNLTTVPLEQRAAVGNEREHTVFVSIHFDQSNYSAASGLETFYAKSKVEPANSWTWTGFFDAPATAARDNGETLAGYIQTAMIARTQATNRGIKPRDLHVVRNVQAPAVLVEGGFLSNAFDARLVATPEYRDRLAAGIAEGILSWHRSLPREPDQPQLAKAAP